jgi:hypothetical protein
MARSHTLPVSLSSIQSLRRLSTSPKLGFNDPVQARARVLDWARKTGSISNAQACKVGRWGQAWYHLNKLTEAGLLRRTGFNVWVPVKRRKK